MAGETSGLTMETQEIKQSKQEQVCISSKEKHTVKDDDQHAGITPIKVRPRTEEIFQKVKVRRAEALRLLADH